MINKLGKQGENTMTKHLAKGPFVVLETYEQESKYGGNMIVVVMASTTPEIVHTYIDPSNDNFSYWKDIITLKEHNYGVIIDNLKYKVKKNEIQKRYIKGWNKEEPLINADSMPTIIYTTENPQEIIDQLAEVLEPQV